jgi:hypothetical protein
MRHTAFAIRLGRPSFRWRFAWQSNPSLRIIGFLRRYQAGGLYWILRPFGLHPNFLLPRKFSLAFDFFGPRQPTIKQRQFVQNGQGLRTSARPSQNTRQQHRGFSIKRTRATIGGNQLLGLEIVRLQIERLGFDQFRIGTPAGKLRGSKKSTQGVVHDRQDSCDDRNRPQQSKSP